MLVKDLAAKYNIAEDAILSTLKALKLRAKGADQELSPAVLMVLKGDLEEKGLIPKEPEPEVKGVKKPVRKPAVKKAPEATEDAVEKTAERKKEAKSKDQEAKPRLEKPVESGRK